MSSSKNIKVPLLWGREYNKKKYPSSPLQDAQSPPRLLLSWVCYITPTGTLSTCVLYGIQLWKQGKKQNSALRSAYPQACQWQVRPSTVFDWHHSQSPMSEGTQINFHSGVLLRTSRAPRLSRTSLRDKASRNFKRMGELSCISQANLWHTHF